MSWLIFWTLQFLAKTEMKFSGKLTVYIVEILFQSYGNFIIFVDCELINKIHIQLCLKLI